MTEFYNRLAAQLARQVAAYQAPWQTPKEPGQDFLPTNPVSGKRYKGINAIALAAEAVDQGYADNRWLTAAQAERLGASMKPNQAGTPIQFTQTTAVVDGQRVSLEKPRTLLAVVYNAQQFEGLPEHERTIRPIEERSGDIRRVIINGKAALVQDANGGPARYDPTTDKIWIKARDPGTSVEQQHVEAVHQLAHWTGHPSRSGRDISHPPGSAGHAREELRANLASLMLGDDMRIGFDPGQHQALAGPWREIIVNDPTEIFRAAVVAERITADLSILSQQWNPPELTQDQMQTLAKQTVARPGVMLEGDHPNLKQSIERTTAAVVTRDMPTILEVPFSQRRKAIAAGALWNAGVLHAPANTDLAPFQSWVLDRAAVPDLYPQVFSRPVSTVPTPEPSNVIPMDRALRHQKAPEPVREQAAPDMKTRTYLAVPYEQRDRAKTAGATWDKEAKAWFAPAGANLAAFGQWLPDKSRIAVTAKQDPIEEFRDKARQMGLIIEGVPVVGGTKLTYVPVVGDKPGEKRGSYSLHLDGRPAGYIRNNRTETALKWKAGTTQSLTPEDRSHLHAAAAQAKQERAIAVEASYARVATQIEAVWNAAQEQKQVRTENGQTWSCMHPYLTNKGIEGKGLRVKFGTENEPVSALLVPVRDIDGKLTSLQTIDPDGNKKFWPGGKVQGGSCIIGDQKDTAWPLIICEGYATGETLHKLTGATVAVAFNAGNLAAVAQAQREKNPHRTIYVAGDNDHTKEGTVGQDGKPRINVGKVKAQEAAELVRGVVLIPQFDRIADAGRSDWNDLAKADPAKARMQVAAGMAIGRAKEREVALEIQRATTRGRGASRPVPSHQREHAEHQGFSR